jgi:diguanylate cyclase (GGDEF)-like protein
MTIHNRGMLETIVTLEARLAEADTDVERVRALNALVWTLRSMEPLRALALSEKAVGLARATDDPQGLTQSLCLLGICGVVLSRHEEARVALAESLAVSREIGDRFTEARCLHYFGVAHYFLAENAQATERVTAALEIFEVLEDVEWLGAGYNIMGNIQFSLCDYSGALDWYARGLEARERAGDQMGVAASLGNIGNVYSERGDLAEALVFHQRSLDQSIRIGNKLLEVSSLCNLGGDYADLGRYEEAIEICRRSVELGEALEDWEKVAVALTSMGFAYGKTRRQAEALACHRRALEIARTNTLQKATAHALFSIGEILLGQGTLDEALSALTEAAALAGEIGARRTEFQSFQVLVEVCRRQGAYATALAHFETFHRIEKEVFTEEAEERARFLVIQLEVEHHRREAEALAEINAALQETNVALQEANARLEALATTDPLTGLPNHRALVAAMDAQTARARREEKACALLFVDIDHFKSVNDTHGHPVGDAVLREFVACVRTCLREEDILGRWGGEEFLILLPGTDADRAIGVAERVRAAVAEQPLLVRNNPHRQSLHVTCSIGAAATPPHLPVRDDLVSAADQALYAAKRQGRNQVRGAKTGD